MKFSEQWLREWVNPQLSTEALAEQLSMAGLEVDDIEPVAGEFSGVVVGEVKGSEQHPNADKLRVTRVDVGSGELLSIVCGAPNARQGIKVAVAMIGAVLPGNFKIKKTKLRGEPSIGMLCSASELGLSEDHEGILELPEDAPIGKDLREWLGLDDKSLTIDLTPNRADCLGVKGLAREIGVLNRLDVKSPKIDYFSPTIDDERVIKLDAPEACPRYLGRVIKGVDVNRPTPLWMAEKLRRSGVRSIDPIVDITNYVLLELGHPMHAFDLDKIEGNVIVRHAQTKEQLTLLDGNEVTLQDDVLVIADDNKPMAIAGIFGGVNTGVTEDSVNIFLESAFFAPDAIMGRSRRFGLHTDASHRYERGVDPELQRTAMERATGLIIEICGGEAGPVTEAVAPDSLPQPAQILLRPERLKRVLGITVDSGDVEIILQRLGFEYHTDAEGWHVSVPTYRFDISIEEDLIEEVARVYGYNNIPAEFPTAHLTMTRIDEATVNTRRLQQSLVALGYQEAITYSFVDPKHQAALFPESATLTLPHPISVDMSSMRLSLWPGLLAAAGYNQKRQKNDVRLFETGLRFVPDENAENGIRQQPMLAGIITGTLQGEHWSDGVRAVDFFDVKGHVEKLLAMTGCGSEYTFTASEHTALHPGQSAAIFRGDVCVGHVGALHPQFDKTFGIRGKAYLFELSLDVIQKGMVPQAGVVSRYPSIRRDLAVLVDNHIAAGEILNFIWKVGVNHIVDLDLFDKYVGENIPTDKQSLAIAFTLQAEDKTLEEQEVNEAIAQIVEKLQNEFNAVLRDS